MEGEAEGVPIETAPPAEETKVVIEEVAKEEKEGEGGSREGDKKEELTESSTESAQKDKASVVRAEVERPGSTLTRIEEEPEIEATATG